MIQKIKLSPKQYRVLFKRVYRAFGCWSNEKLKRDLRRHWKKSPLKEKREVVDDMLELGTLKYPRKKQRKEE